MTALLPFLSLVVFTFGVPAFSILAFSYWRHGHGGSVVLRVFTVVCAAAFLANLASLVFFFDQLWFVLARSVLVGLLPPMMSHLVLEQEECGWAGPRAYRVLLWLLYAAALLSALAGETSWSDALADSSQLILAAASLLAAALLIVSRKHRSHSDRRQRAWNLVVFALLLSSAVVAIVNDNPIFRIAPDYLLLLFFAVRLYYTERLAFFDVFLKGGSFVAAGAMLVTLVLLALPVSRNALGGDWIRSWLVALALMPVWLMGPPLYQRLSRWIDHALDRKYSSIEAERLFMQEAQASTSAEQLLDLANQCLREIFHCRVEIGFGDEVEVGDLVCSIAPAGRIRLFARENQVPFLSDDRRLLERLAATL